MTDLLGSPFDRDRGLVAASYHAGDISLEEWREADAIIAAKEEAQLAATRTAAEREAVRLADERAAAVAAEREAKVEATRKKRAPYDKAIAELRAVWQAPATEAMFTLAIQARIATDKLARLARERNVRCDEARAKIKSLRDDLGEPLEPGDVPNVQENLSPDRVVTDMVAQAFMPTATATSLFNAFKISRPRFDAFTRMVAAAGGPDRCFRFATADESERYFTARRDVTRTARVAEQVRQELFSTQALQPGDPRRASMHSRTTQANAVEARAAEHLRLVVRELEASNVDVPALAASFAEPVAEPTLADRVSNIFGRAIEAIKPSGGEPPSAA